MLLAVEYSNLVYLLKDTKNIPLTIPLSRVVVVVEALQCRLLPIGLQLNLDMVNAAVSPGMHSSPLRVGVVVVVADTVRGVQLGDGGGGRVAGARVLRNQPN